MQLEFQKNTSYSNLKVDGYKLEHIQDVQQFSKLSSVRESILDIGEHTDRDGKVEGFIPKDKSLKDFITEIRTTHLDFYKTLEGKQKFNELGLKSSDGKLIDVDQFIDTFDHESNELLKLLEGEKGANLEKFIAGDQHVTPQTIGDINKKLNIDDLHKMQAYLKDFHNKNTILNGSSNTIADNMINEVLDAKHDATINEFNTKKDDIQSFIKNNETYLTQAQKDILNEYIDKLNQMESLHTDFELFKSGNSEKSIGELYSSYISFMNIVDKQLINYLSKTQP